MLVWPLGQGMSESQSVGNAWEDLREDWLEVLIAKIQATWPTIL